MNLSELLKLGIIASIGGDGGLQLDAPKGAITPELIERIRHHKPGLIAEIRAAREVGELGELHFLCRNPVGEELPPAGDVHRETPTGTAPPIRATCWLLHYVDREPREMFVAPPMTHAEVLAGYPAAVAAEPIPERTDTRTATVTERGELLALIQAIYAADTERDRQEAIGAALADPGGSLACYRAIAAERGIEVRTAQVRTQVRTETAAQSCRSCRHRKRPGRADPGYCGGGRDDLPGAYGLHHPLRKLPGDQGASCAVWRGFDD